MEKQLIINTIVALTGTLDALTRSGDEDSKKIVIEKILELIKSL